MSTLKAFALRVLFVFLFSFWGKPKGIKAPKRTVKPAIYIVFPIKMCIMI